MTATDTRTVEDLHAMEPYEFEYFLADLWRRQGYEAEVSQQSADGGVDVIAKNGDETVAIQAKRYGNGNPVGVKTIRETSNLTKRPEVDRTAVATSGSFTRSAYKEANQYDVKLYDGEELLELDHNASAVGGLSANTAGSVASAAIGVLLAAAKNPEDTVDVIVNLIVAGLLLYVAFVVFGALLRASGIPLPI